MESIPYPHPFVRWFRDSAPYIHAFRGKTFIIAFGGEVVADAQFPALAHDLALLNSLGVRLVLVHGARPQIESRLNSRKVELLYVNGLRVTDGVALQCVMEAAGVVRVEIEALLSMGLANSPMAGARIRVAGGNFVAAQPLGVREGIDYQHTGEVRRIDVEALRAQLDQGAIVLLSPIGYSPTGEVFNLSAEDVATAAAIQLKADKLIYLVDGPLPEGREGQQIREITPNEGEVLLGNTPLLSDSSARPLFSALYACQGGVPRAHLIERHIDGGLLLELFTRDGIGTLISNEIYEGTRRATLEDVGGIIELIQPLERDGILVRRSREKLEMEIDHFSVVERDGMVIACAALYPYPKEGFAELACLAVHPDYRRQGRGDELLAYIERLVIELKIQHIFVLTTRTAHWFLERGFLEAPLRDIPMERQQLYNYQRRSKVFIKRVRG
jgi:amino-acid N-acetyltransferase